MIPDEMQQKKIKKTFLYQYLYLSLPVHNQNIF